MRDERENVIDSVSEAGDLDEVSEIGDGSASVVIGDVKEIVAASEVGTFDVVLRDCGKSAMFPRDSDDDNGDEIGSVKGFVVFDEAGDRVDGFVVDGDGDVGGGGCAVDAVDTVDDDVNFDGDKVVVGKAPGWSEDAIFPANEISKDF